MVHYIENIKKYADEGEFVCKKIVNLRLFMPPMTMQKTVVSIVPESDDGIDAGRSNCGINTGYQANQYRKDNRSEAQPPGKAKVMNVWHTLPVGETIND